MADIKLEIEPADKIIFSSKKLGEESASTTWKITNKSKDRIVYKVKTTSNELFRIRPPVGALKPGEDVTVNLVFNSGTSVPDNGKHYFVCYYVIATDDTKNPRQTWSESKEPEGNKKLFVDFNKDGDDKSEEKKDEKEEDKKEEKKDDKKEDKKDSKEDKKDSKEDKKDEKKDVKDEKKDEKKDVKDEKNDKKDVKDEKKDAKEDKKDDKKEGDKEEKKTDEKKE